MTFLEAYRKTGRIFCVTLSSTTKKAPPVLLNYLTAPDVTLASAVIASAAVPGFVPPVRLQYSTYKFFSDTFRIDEIDELVKGVESLIFSNNFHVRRGQQRCRSFAGG